MALVLTQRRPYCPLGATDSTTLLIALIENVQTIDRGSGYQLQCAGTVL